MFIYNNLYKVTGMSSFISFSYVQKFWLTVISVLINVKLGNEFLTYEVQFYIECVGSVGEQIAERGR